MFVFVILHIVVAMLALRLGAISLPLSSIESIDGSIMAFLLS